MWASGMSPYAPERATLFAQYGLLHVYEVPAPFFYPPHSVFLLAPLGFLPPGGASMVFSFVNFIVLVASSMLAADIIRSAGAPGSRLSWASAHAIFLVAGWTATSIIFFHNIVTLIVYCGLLAMLRGAQTRRGTLVALGAFFALLSPQMSAAAAIALMMRRRSRSAMIAGFVLIGATSLIGLAPGGIFRSLEAMLANLSTYSSYPVNSNAYQSGVGFIMAALFGLSPGSGAALAGCVATLTLFALFGDRQGENEEARSVEFGAVAIVVGLFFLPSLSHYYVAAIPAVTLLVLTKGGWRWFAAPGALMLMLSLDLLSAPDGVPWLSGRETAAATDSIGVALLFAASLWRWTAGRPSAPRNRPAAIS